MRVETRSLLWRPKSHKREHTTRRTVFVSILAITTRLCEALLRKIVRAFILVPRTRPIATSHQSPELAGITGLGQHKGCDPNLRFNLGMSQTCHARVIEG